MIKVQLWNNSAANEVSRRHNNNKFQQHKWWERRNQYRDQGITNEWPNDLYCTTSPDGGVMHNTHTHNPLSTHTAPLNISKYKMISIF